MHAEEMWQWQQQSFYPRPSGNLFSPFSLERIDTYKRKTFCRCSLRIAGQHLCNNKSITNSAYILQIRALSQSSSLSFGDTLQSQFVFDKLWSCDLFSHAEKYRFCFSWFFFNWKSKMSDMFSPESDFIFRFPHQGPVPAPRWVPMLCVSCVNQWADLIWADPSDAPLSPILCRCSRMPHWPPRWASGGLYLNPADSNKHIHHCRPLPGRLTAVKTKSLWRSDTVSATQFSEVEPPNASANIFPLNMSK